jgi:hypothetical protein
MRLGAAHAEEPFVLVSGICTAYYFSWFIIQVPLLSRVEDLLQKLGTRDSSL